jgi:hypothetical protein
MPAVSAARAAAMSRSFAADTSPIGTVRAAS